MLSINLWVKQKRNLQGQKDRTQKNEARIFLRSIFLPYNWFRSVRLIYSSKLLVI
jgi:hypothetical protein